MWLSHPAPVQGGLFTWLEDVHQSYISVWGEKKDHWLSWLNPCSWPFPSGAAQSSSWWVLVMLMAVCSGNAQNLCSDFTALLPELLEITACETLSSIFTARETHKYSIRRFKHHRVALKDQEKIRDSSNSRESLIEHWDGTDQTLKNHCWIWEAVIWLFVTSYFLWDPEQTSWNWSKRRVRVDLKRQACSAWLCPLLQWLLWTASHHYASLVY